MMMSDDEMWDILLCVNCRKDLFAVLSTMLEILSHNQSVCMRMEIWGICKFLILFVGIWEWAESCDKSWKIVNFSSLLFIFCSHDDRDDLSSIAPPPTSSDASYKWTWESTWNENENRLNECKSISGQKRKLSRNEKKICKEIISCCIVQVLSALKSSWVCWEPLQGWIICKNVFSVQAAARLAIENSRKTFPSQPSHPRTFTAQFSPSIWSHY